MTRQALLQKGPRRPSLQDRSEANATRRAKRCSVQRPTEIDWTPVRVP